METIITPATSDSDPLQAVIQRLAGYHITYDGPRLAHRQAVNAFRTTRITQGPSRATASSPASKIARKRTRWITRSTEYVLGQLGLPRGVRARPGLIWTGPSDRGQKYETSRKKGPPQQHSVPAQTSPSAKEKRQRGVGGGVT
ncbi:hypothetical protein FS749_006994 [Ceratobasidium sp. UAMH 11750]|nr:hypothetical protein FS749_006994 [Ceratobasidium sp. UAMH 11750]